MLLQISKKLLLYPIAYNVCCAGLLLFLSFNVGGCKVSKVANSSVAPGKKKGRIRTKATQRGSAPKARQQGAPAKVTTASKALVGSDEVLPGAIGKNAVQEEVYYSAQGPMSTAIEKKNCHFGAGLYSTKRHEARGAGH